MSDSPYKFLNYYEYDPPDKDDQCLFFGRERETRILLADVLVSRLVVLFAKTGTGKTSLINAGVRPQLEKQQYATFFIRVREDPVESARLELQKRLKSALTGQSLLEIMLDVGKRFPEQSRVLFFDQFEEFFIYVKPGSEKGRQFISDVARIFEDSQSGVHIVFSMREEWFYEMDAFRDEIPTIFHNDSNLRLRWFDEEQARAAIEEPARIFHVTFDPELVDQLIRDLSDPAEGGMVEPAQIQIVCDTLWRHCSDGKITLDDYRKLGNRADRSISVARQVLFQRLEEDFQKIKEKQELDLLVRVLPELRTPRRTKRLWELSAFANYLSADTKLLELLVQHLEKESGLLRTTPRGDQVLLELAHDYLVEGLDEIAQRVRFIWPQRVLRNAWEAYNAEGKLATVLDLETISPHAYELSITAEQWQFLFRSAIEVGDPARLWFERANSAGVDVWTIMEKFLFDSTYPVTTYSVFRLLGELKSDRALDLLERAMQREDLAASAIETIGEIQVARAAELLEKGSKLEQWLPQVRVALERLTRSRNEAVAQHARDVMKKLTETQRPRGLAGIFWRPTLESRDASDRRFASDSRVSVPLDQIRSFLEKGQVIPFLGTGVGVTARQSGERWVRESKFPPTSQELAETSGRDLRIPN
jgi:hypothetical protein